jgi:hypothetical protein
MELRLAGKNMRGRCGGCSIERMDMYVNREECAGFWMKMKFGGGF